MRIIAAFTVRIFSENHGAVFDHSVFLFALRPGAKIRPGTHKFILSVKLILGRTKPLAALC
jgi:hypothetical protein